MTMGKLDWIPKLFDLHQILVTDNTALETERNTAREETKQAERERDNLDKTRLRLIAERDEVSLEAEALGYEVHQLAEEQVVWEEQRQRYHTMQEDHQGRVDQVITERDTLQAVIDEANAELERRTTMLSKRARQKLGLGEETE